MAAEKRTYRTLICEFSFLFSPSVSFFSLCFVPLSPSPCLLHLFLPFFLPMTCLSFLFCLLFCVFLLPVSHLLSYCLTKIFCLFGHMLWSPPSFLLHVCLFFSFFSLVYPCCSPCSLPSRLVNLETLTRRWYLLCVPVFLLPCCSQGLFVYISSWDGERLREALSSNLSDMLFSSQPHSDFNVLLLLVFTPSSVFCFYLLCFYVAISFCNISSLWAMHKFPFVCHRLFPVGGRSHWPTFAFSSLLPSVFL